MARWKSGDHWRPKQILLNAHPAKEENIVSRRYWLWRWRYGCGVNA